MEPEGLPAFLTERELALGADARLGRDEGHAYGTLPSGTDFEPILNRALEI